MRKYLVIYAEVFSHNNLKYSIVQSTLPFTLLKYFQSIYHDLWSKSIIYRFAQVYYSFGFVIHIVGHLQAMYCMKVHLSMVNLCLHTVANVVCILMFWALIHIMSRWCVPDRCVPHKLLDDPSIGRCFPDRCVLTLSLTLSPLWASGMIATATKRLRFSHWILFEDVPSAWTKEL